MFRTSHRLRTVFQEATSIKANNWFWIHAAENSFIRSLRIKWGEFHDLKSGHWFEMESLKLTVLCTITCLSKCLSTCMRIMPTCIYINIISLHSALSSSVPSTHSLSTAWGRNEWSGPLCNIGYLAQKAFDCCIENSVFYQTCSAIDSNP